MEGEGVVINRLLPLMIPRHASEAQSMVEYALILLLVSTVTVAILTTFGLNVVANFTTAVNAF